MSVGLSIAFSPRTAIITPTLMVAVEHRDHRGLLVA